MNRTAALILVALSATAATAASVVSAQASSKLERALLDRLTVWEKPDGDAVRVVHCRKAPGGCEARVRLWARWIEESAERHEVDPWTLAAIVVRESGGHPFVGGSAGERGIAQFHPDSPWGRKLRFVRSAGYRRRCRRKTGACQKPVIDAAAELLARCRARCGGESAALRCYNSGSCERPEKYSARVLEERRKLARAAE